MGDFEGGCDEGNDLGEVFQFEVREGVESSDFYDAFDFAVVREGGDADIGGGSFTEAGGDMDIVIRGVGDGDLFLFEGGLADEAFAEFEFIGEVLASWVFVLG